MGRSIRTEPLIEAELRVADGQKRIVQQEKLLAEMHFEGQDLSLIRMTLRTLKDLQVELEKQRDELLREQQSND
jgi:hypothetical protein